MCLYVDQEATEKLRKKLDKVGQIEVYKYLRMEGGKLKPPFGYCHFNFSYGKGTTKAAGRRSCAQIIHGGALHADLESNRSKRSSCGYMIFVKLIGKKEDFIAAGRRDDVAFYKLTITDEEAKRVKKNAKRRGYLLDL